MIKDNLQKIGWIKVEDQMPEENQPCILRVDYVTDKAMFIREPIGIFNDGVWKCYDLYPEPNIISVIVTHWKPVEFKEVK